VARLGAALVGWFVFPQRPVEDLEQRLAHRKVAELLHHKGRLARGHGDFLLRHDRVVGPLLRAALQLLRLYTRGVDNARSPVVRRLRVQFDNLPAEFNGYRILHLSDLHIDGFDGLAEVLASLVSTVPVDLCLMTGDYRYEVEGSCAGVYPRIATVLAGVRARDGIAAVLGNHDAAEIAVQFEKMGVRMLVNESVQIERAGASIWVAGIDDPHYYGCDDLPAALRDVPPGAFRILLSHSPELFEEAAARDVRLYLCGHTHGGQIGLPLLGAPLLNARCPRAYTRGLWRHGAMQGYTSAGAGCSMLPVRYNCPPEIVEMVLWGGPPGLPSSALPFSS